MRFLHQLRYDAAPEDVYSMLADPAFRLRVCEAQHAHGSNVKIDPAGAGMSVAIDQKRPSDGIPGFARKIVGDEIHIVQREDWAEGHHAALDVSIPGKPGHLKGTVRLEGDSEATVETVSGNLTVHVPLVGGKLEHLIAELLEVALVTEERVGKAWLGGER